MSSQLYDQGYFQKIRGAAEGDSLYAGFMALLDGPPEGELAPDHEARALRRQGLAVLDLGCGRGEMVERLDRAGVEEVHGMDFSAAAVELTRSRISPGQAGNIICGSATDSSLYPPGTFDVIFMLDVVEHLPPPELLEALRNARLWLRPGGRLIVHTFPTLGMHRLYRAWLFLSGQHSQLRLLDQIHCNVQTQERLRQTLSEAGFEQPTLWLRNDFTRTSSTFQDLPEGIFKRTLGTLLDNVLGHPRVVALFSRLGLAEWACPSIYGIARV